MTIDSTWLCAFKEELPHAFTKKRPFTPAAAFVDGQIRLMQGMQSEPQTWDDFIFRQFARHLQRIFEVCDVVVLAFDNYEHVPTAKCMTQLKRRRNVPPIPFSAHSELPCMVPEGERWTQCISNRTFKGRVIDLVLLRLPALLLHLKPGRRFIVDYQDPVEYRFNPETNQIQRRTLEGFPPLGEADLKFVRHASMHGSLLVDSIDGDSIPIALMHHEAELRKGLPPPNVAVYRLELKVLRNACSNRFQAAIDRPLFCRWTSPSRARRSARRRRRRARRAGPTSTSTSTPCMPASRTSSRSARAGCGCRATPPTRSPCWSRSSP
jgi:hypothetical protein